MRGIAALTVFAIHVWIYQLPNTVDAAPRLVGELLLFEGRVAFVMFFVLSGLPALPRVRACGARAGRARVDARQLPGAARGPDRARLLRRDRSARSCCSSAAGDVPGRRLVDAGEAAAVLRVRAELLARHAAEAERGDLDAGGRGRLLSDAAGDRPARAAARASARRRQAALLGGARGWPASAGTSSTISPAGARSPATRRRRSCPTSPAGCWSRCWSSARRARERRALGPRQSALLVARRGRLLVANGCWHAPTGPAHGFAMEVFADLGAAVAFAAMIAALVLGTGAGLRWLGWRPLAWIGHDHLRLLPLAHPA